MFSPVLVEHRLVSDTDRQTDGRTQGHSIYHASIASRGKNVPPRHNACVAWWRSGWSAGLATAKVDGFDLALSANNLGQVVHTRVTVTEQYNLVPVKRR